MCNNQLESMVVTLEKVGFPSKIVGAPKGAVTFDKMLIVYSTKEMKTIKQVHLYSSTEDKFISRF